MLQTIKYKYKIRVSCMELLITKYDEQKFVTSTICIFELDSNFLHCGIFGLILFIIYCFWFKMTTERNSNKSTFIKTCLILCFDTLFHFFLISIINNSCYCFVYLNLNDQMCFIKEQKIHSRDDSWMQKDKHGFLYVSFCQSKIFLKYSSPVRYKKCRQV